MQAITDSRVAGIRPLSLKAGITMLYLGYCDTLPYPRLVHCEEDKGHDTAEREQGLPARGKSSLYRHVVDPKGAEETET